MSQIAAWPNVRKRQLIFATEISSPLDVVILIRLMGQLLIESYAAVQLYSRFGG